MLSVCTHTHLELYSDSLIQQRNIMDEKRSSCCCWAQWWWRGMQSGCWPQLQHSRNKKKKVKNLKSTKFYMLCPCASRETGAPSPYEYLLNMSVAAAWVCLYVSCCCGCYFLGPRQSVQVDIYQFCGNLFSMCTLYEYALEIATKKLEQMWKFEG